jgi:large subunit ribosomal protein L13
LAEVGHGSSKLPEHRTLAGHGSSKLPEHRTLAEENKIFIDGTDLILGRVASYVAKLVILGKKVALLNCNKLIITGSKQIVIDSYKDVMENVKGRHKGPFYPRKAENLVRETIAGMLPKTDRGRAILKNIEVYRDVPKEYAGHKMVSLEDFKKSANVTKFVTVGELEKQLRG